MSTPTTNKKRKARPPTAPLDPVEAAEAPKAPKAREAPKARKAARSKTSLTAKAPKEAKTSTKAKKPKLSNRSLAKIRANFLCGTNSKERDHVATPDWLYYELNDEFDFDFDPCPLRCTEFDGLAVPWGRTNFVNPPFSRNALWMQKAIQERDTNGATTVMLVPARVNTNYWQRWVLPEAAEIRFIVDRITFVGFNAPMPTVVSVVVYRPGCRPANGTRIRTHAGGTLRWISC